MSRSSISYELHNLLKARPRDAFLPKMLLGKFPGHSHDVSVLASDI